MAPSRVNAQRVKALEREQEALLLRRQGLNYEQIGRQLGVNTTTAWRAVQRGYKRSLKLVEETADFNRNLELERLDVAMNAIWLAVERGEGRAIDRMLAIMERRSKLLGLDAPTRQEHSGSVLVREYVGIDVAEV